MELRLGERAPVGAALKVVRVDCVQRRELEDRAQRHLVLHL